MTLWERYCAGFGRVWRLPLLKSAGVILALALVLHAFNFYSIPFWPFTTTGQIYVDSPEVYTRERLVNDRYEQDYWLRQRLKELDEPEKLSLIGGTEASHLSFGTGSSPDSNSSDNAGGDANPGSGDRDGQRLSFDQEFRVSAGIRDTIRQQLLENMLDDRHDLTGNSVFGLKFDTTVIPGTNTRQRAFVHVQLFVAPFSGDLQDLNFECGSETPEPPRTPPRDLFENWVKDVQRRLNLAEDFLYDSIVHQCKEEHWSEKDLFDKLTGKALETVLGIPEERFWLLLQGQERELQRQDAEAVQRCERSPEEPGCCMTLARDRTVDEELTLEVSEACPELLQPKSMMIPDGKDDGSPQSGSVVLPDPWSRYFIVDRRPFNPPDVLAGKETLCRQRVWFDVSGLEEKLWIRKENVSNPCNQSSPNSGDGAACAKQAESVTDKDAGASTVADTPSTTESPEDSDKAPARPTYDPDEMVEIWSEIQAPTSCSYEDAKEEPLEPAKEPQDAEIAFVDWSIATSRLDYDWLKTRQEKTQPKYRVDARRLECTVQQSQETCRSYPDDYKCSRIDKGYHYLEMDSGFWNFRDYLARRNLYPYAIFPKNDVVGVISDSREQLSVVSPVQGVLDFARRSLRSRTESVLVGYGLGGGSSWNQGQDQTIDFGWVISARPDMQPTQKSQLALVSVPAWTDTLNLCVRVGWLDRWGDANEDRERAFLVPITVPPNLEAFDSIFREDAQVTLGPTIIDSQMDDRIYIRTGEKVPPVKILIPGSRLWRSTTVTLGAQPASRITVLPNMEGIIAEFDYIDPPYAVFSPNTDDGHRHFNPKPRTDRQETNEAAANDGGESSGIDDAVSETQPGDASSMLANATSSNHRYPSSEYDDQAWAHCLFQDQIEKQGRKVRPVRLRVWTSEGMDQARHPVCLIYTPPEGKPAPEAESAPETQSFQAAMETDIAVKPLNQAGEAAATADAPSGTPSVKDPSDGSN